MTESQHLLRVVLHALSFSYRLYHGSENLTQVSLDQANRSDG